MFCHPLNILLVFSDSGFCSLLADQSVASKGEKLQKMCNKTVRHCHDNADTCPSNIGSVTKWLSRIFRHKGGQQVATQRGSKLLVTLCSKLGASLSLAVKLIIKTVHYWKHRVYKLSTFLFLGHLNITSYHAGWRDMNIIVTLQGVNTGEAGCDPGPDNGDDNSDAGDISSLSSLRPHHHCQSANTNTPAQNNNNV